MSGGIPIDLILFGMVAAFLVLRLRSVLGRRTGHERPPRPYQPPGQPTPQHAPGEPPPEPEAAALPPPPALPREAYAAAAARGVPDPASPAGQGLARLRAIDPAFDPQRFLENAQAAFGLVIAAFARGDRRSLRGLLSPEVFIDFERAIADREQAGETLHTELVAVREAGIVEAELRGSIAAVTVRFITDQVNMTRDAKGEIVAGSEAITEVADIWTFSRDLQSADPTWLLVATRSGE